MMLLRLKINILSCAIWIVHFINTWLIKIKQSFFMFHIWPILESEISYGETWKTKKLQPRTENQFVVAIFFVRKVVCITPLFCNIKPPLQFCISAPSARGPLLWHITLFVQHLAIFINVFWIKNCLRRLKWPIKNPVHFKITNSSVKKQLDSVLSLGFSCISSLLKACYQ